MPQRACVRRSSAKKQPQDRKAAAPAETNENNDTNKTRATPSPGKQHPAPAQIL